MIRKLFKLWSLYLQPIWGFNFIPLVCNIFDFSILFFSIVSLLLSAPPYTAIHIICCLSDLSESIEFLLNHFFSLILKDYETFLDLQSLNVNLGFKIQKSLYLGFDMRVMRLNRKFLSQGQMQGRLSGVRVSIKQVIDQVLISNFR